MVNAIVEFQNTAKSFLPVKYVQCICKITTQYYYISSAQALLQDVFELRFLALGENR